MVLSRCANSFNNVSNHSRVLQRKRKNVMQCLTLNFDLDLEPTLVKRTQCTLTNHTCYLYRVICKSHQRLKLYRAETIVCLTLNYPIDLEVTLVKHALCTSSNDTLHVCQVF